MNKNKFNVSNTILKVPNVTFKVPKMSFEIPKFTYSINDYIGKIKSYNDIYRNLFSEITEPMRRVVSLNSKFSMSIQNLFKDVFKFDLSEIIEDCDDTFKNILLYNLKVFGEFGWCLFGVELFEETRQSTILIAKSVVDYLREDKLSLDNIDEYIGEAFTEDMLNSIKGETLLFLDDFDKVKLELAFKYFYNCDYLASVYLLASLIDAQSIKQEIYDNSINNYDKITFYNKKTNQFEASQGWRSFYRTFENNFKYLFDEKSIKSTGKESLGALEDITNTVKLSDSYNLDLVCPIIHLSYCMCEFFRNVDWSNYKNKKPNVVNRHWIMHGMYSLDDVSKYDCIKLLLMLNKLVLLYKKVKSKEI